MKWTNKMYQYLSALVLEEMLSYVSLDQKEKRGAGNIIKEVIKSLSEDEQKIVQNSARRLIDDYHDDMMHSLEKMYWHELRDDHNHSIRPCITYNNEHYEIWTQAVRKRQTVKMKYDSTSSGISERLVDPHSTRSPYIKGYCHLRKEIRKFRLDRIIDIEYTNQKFIKPKI